MNYNKRVLRIHREGTKYYVPIEEIWEEIRNKGYRAGSYIHWNDTTYEIHTNMPVEEVRRLPGVFDAI